METYGTVDIYLYQSRPWHKVDAEEQFHTTAASVDTVK
jgi:hypothetical protein